VVGHLGEVHGDEVEAQTSACCPVSSCWPAYCETDGIIDGVICVPAFGCANAVFGGK
jgi:hypothetical protein